MESKIKFYFLPIIIFSLFTSLFPQNTEPSGYFVQNVDIEKIKEKEDFYRNLFNPKRKLKKAAIVSTGIFSTIFLSYLGFKHWSNNKANKIKETEDEHSDEVSNDISTGETDINKIIRLLAAKESYQEKFKRNGSIKKAGKYGFFGGIRKGIKNGIVTFISLGVLYVASDILNPMKETFISFFRSNDEEHFQRIILNLRSSLKQLQTLLALKNGSCYKEEIVDHYNFFIENVENFLSIISAVSQKRINAINNCQSIKNEQNLMYKNVFEFSESLTKALNESTNIFFDEAISDKIFANFKPVNNQISRFINLSNAVIYEG